MKIDTHLLTAGIPAVPGQQRGDASGLFAGYLADQMAMAGDAATAGDDAAESDVDIIRKKGFTGFFKELRAQRMEELRKEILAGMGLTEEDLADMPPEQRAAIEKMVAEEIKKRLAAEAVMENDNEKNGHQGMIEQAMVGEQLGSGFLFAREKPAETEPLTGRQGDEEESRQKERFPFV